MKDKALIDELLNTRNMSAREDMSMFLIEQELERARKWPAMNSAHEGYAVLLEEVDELWEHVKKRQGERDIPEMTYEAIQVAAMALRFIVDVCRPSVAIK